VQCESTRTGTARGPFALPTVPSCCREESFLVLPSTCRARPGRASCSQAAPAFRCRRFRRPPAKKAAPAGKAGGKKAAGKPIGPAMDEDVIPALKEILGKEKDIDNLALVFDDNEVSGTVLLALKHCATVLALCHCATVLALEHCATVLALCHCATVLAQC